MVMPSIPGVLAGGAAAETVKLTAISVADTVPLGVRWKPQVQIRLTPDGRLVFLRAYETDFEIADEWLLPRRQNAGEDYEVFAVTTSGDDTPIGDPLSEWLSLRETRTWGGPAQTEQGSNTVDIQLSIRDAVTQEVLDTSSLFKLTAQIVPS